LPGLNAAASVGDEVRPYVETAYPAAAAAPIYREEPVGLVFTEAFSTLLPVDRVPAPSDPPEKAQLLQLALDVDRIASGDGLARVTTSSPDWLSLRNAPILRPPGGRLNDGPPLGGGRNVRPPGLVLTVEPRRSLTRNAPTIDPRRGRFEAMRAVADCAAPDQLHASQVLVHDPVGADGTPGPWEPQTRFRASARVMSSPHLERSSFRAADLRAFLWQSDGGALPAAWRPQDGALQAPAIPGGRQYASFGELTWDHLQISSHFEPGDAVAGIGVGVADGSPVPQGLLATVEPGEGGRVLVLRARSGGAERELGRSNRPVPGGEGPVTLTVTTFDDVVRAAVGDLTLEAPRGPIRNGRVALVADGPARFSGAAVDGLELYRFDFATSRYLSFVEHIGSFDGAAAVLSVGAAGGDPQPMAALLAANGSEIDARMSPEADPQARQVLFTRFVTSLCVPLRARCERLELSRLLEMTGTSALLVETPEPLAFTGEVSVALVQHVREIAGIATGPGLSVGDLQFDGDGVSISVPRRTFPEGTTLARVSRASGAVSISFFEAPRTASEAVQLQGSRLTAVPAAASAASRALRDLPDGTVAILRPNGGGISILTPPPTFTLDVPVPLRVLSNGDQTAALLIPVDPAGAAFSLGPGHYTLHFTLDRRRWRSAAADLDSMYHQEQIITLSW
jgi:hypothetical protein